MIVDVYTPYRGRSRPR